MSATEEVVESEIIQISLDMLQQVPKREIKIVCTKATIYVDLINHSLKFFNKKAIFNNFL